MKLRIVTDGTRFKVQVKCAIGWSDYDYHGKVMGSFCNGGGADTWRSELAARNWVKETFGDVGLAAIQEKTWRPL